MRCHYLSDLHLEANDLAVSLPGGDVLIVAGDLCNARCLDPARADRPGSEQRSRVLRFVDAALARFAHVLLVPGNHEHYDGVLEDTAGLLRRHLQGVTVLDDEACEIGGIRFFGATLWTDFEGRSRDAMNRVRRRMGEFFFVRTRRAGGGLARFQPEHALGRHDAAMTALRAAVAGSAGKPTVVVTHHPPSLRGLNPRFAGNGIDAAYASDLDGLVAGLDNVPVWVHGHTHIERSYRIGGTRVVTNALGLPADRRSAHAFSASRSFDV